LALAFEKYAKICEDLRANFSKPFQDLNGRETQMNLFQSPFTMNVENVNDDYAQVEVLDLQSNEALHDAFQAN